MTGRAVKSSVAAILVVAAIALDAPLASAAPTGDFAPSGYRSVTTKTGETVLVADAQPGDKQAWVKSHPMPSDQQPSGLMVTPMSSTVGDSTLKSRGTRNYGNSYMETTGSTYANFHDTAIGWVFFQKTSATNTWWGGSPALAKQISPSCKWYVSGINVSVQIPAGAAFSGSGGSQVTYAPGAVYDVWRAGLSYPYDVKEYATLLYSANFKSYGDFLLTNVWYRVQGN